MANIAAISGFVFPTATDPGTVATTLEQVTSLLNNALRSGNQLQPFMTAQSITLTINTATGTLSYTISDAIGLATLQAAIATEQAAITNAIATLTINLQAYIASIPKTVTIEANRVQGLE